MTKWQAKSGRRVVSGKSIISAGIIAGKIENAKPVIAEAKALLAKDAKPGERFRLELAQGDDRKIGAWSITPVAKKTKPRAAAAAPAAKPAASKAKKAKKAAKPAVSAAKKTKKKAVTKKKVARKRAKTAKRAA